ncbi:MAG: XRE family transcriptional regulator [Epsilonproteobacteria bacterium]|nr:MAG: XRE family transcriptional regulator [Campylobacterota bacterium]
MFLSDDNIHNLHKIIGQNVKNIRIEKEISQLDLTIEIDSKSTGFISRCENYKDNHHFNIEHLYKIAIALNVDINEFFKDIKTTK